MKTRSLRSNRRIVESNSDDDVCPRPLQSEGDGDGIESLARTMKRVQIEDGENNGVLSDTDESLSHASNQKRRCLNRKPDIGNLDDRSLSSLEDSRESSLSSLDDSSDESSLSSHSCSSSDHTCNSSSTGSYSSTLSDEKEPPARMEPMLIKPGGLAKPTSDSSHSMLSDSSILSLSSSSSSDDDYIMKSKTKKKKRSNQKEFSWSFNKTRREYTIGGDDKIPPFSIPFDLYDKLYDFQKDGVAWMVGLYLPKIGGILGDDMGMGKTFTTLSLLGGLMRAKTIKKAVVVAPVSVLRNWENEARRILRLCCNVKIQVISSDMSKFKRQKILHQALEAQSPQLIITSFQLVANNIDYFTPQVARKQVWDYVILDEAHKIKNQATNSNKAMEKLARSDRTRRLILTGTPIMNNLKELYVLFTFATSGKILGLHRDFRSEYGNPIEAARSADASESEIQIGERAMKELQAIIEPYFLQRTKAEYLSDLLPPKHEYVLWTNLSPLQRKMYNDYIQSESVKCLLEGEAKSPMLAITWLQKLCGHPLLVEKESVDMIDEDEFDEHEPSDLMKASTKLQVMYNLVNTLIDNGHRTLIFSQSTKVLDIIQRVLHEEKFKLSRIDGQTKEKDRQKSVDEFNETESDVNIMLISTKAGGQGLTLTGADSCVVYDPSWNPAEDAQAVDRCYRLGQRKDVQVYRLISAGTVEEKRYEKQIHKDGIRRTILTNTGNQTAKYFTKEELQKKVFVLGDEGECEFLEKLEIRGFDFDQREQPEHSYVSLKGVVGQSSHDIVYSLPENFYLEDDIKAPPQQPFSSPPIPAQWFSKKSAPPVKYQAEPTHSYDVDVSQNKENEKRDENSKMELIESDCKTPKPCGSRYVSDISPSFRSPNSHTKVPINRYVLSKEEQLAEARDRARRTMGGNGTSLASDDEEYYEEDYEEEFQRAINHKPHMTPTSEQRDLSKNERLEVARSRAKAWAKSQM